MQFFDVAADFLLGRTDIRRKPEKMKKYALNAGEQTWAGRYRSLCPKQHWSLVLFLDALEREIKVCSCRVQTIRGEKT
jgi:hypothetical protein